MVNLLVVADDFTGALDTGVKFANKGINTHVAFGGECDYCALPQDVEVVVIDSETRHLSPNEAYRIVYSIAKDAVFAGIKHIYKKTDSCLRGNVGSELAAVMDAVGVETLPFIPAYPKMGRTTENNIHYVDGIPIAESAFGKDPFNPVIYSKVSDIIAQQTDRMGICVYDAKTDEDLASIGESLGVDGLSVSSGCAGFAEVLEKKLSLGGKVFDVPELPQVLLVICGSINPVSKRQIKHAEQNGAIKICLDQNGQFTKTDEAWRMLSTQECVLMDTSETPVSSVKDDDRQEKALNLSIGAKKLLDYGGCKTILCIGGDTLKILADTLDIKEFTLISEIECGLPLISFEYNDKTQYLLSKSGGFGGESLITELIEYLQKGKK